MNDVADHEARFHDHGEQVDEPYPQMSEHPLRAGVASITDASAGDGTYTITEMTWSGAYWGCGTAPGQYVEAPARDLNDSTDGSVDDYVLFWEQYDQDGVIELIIYVPAGDEDKKVAVDSCATPGYLGAAFNDGVLRTGDNMSYADGGDFVTLNALGKVAICCGACCVGYLVDVIQGDGTWIELTESGGVITVYNIGPGPSSYSAGCTSGYACWPVFMDFDCIGNMRCIHLGDADGGYESFGPCA